MHTTRRYAPFATLVRQHGCQADWAMGYIIVHPNSLSARRIIEVIVFYRLLRFR
jgi:hypothetical protein